MDGCLLGFSIPSEVGFKLGIPEGLAANELHLTLIYLGKLQDFSDGSLLPLRHKLSELCASLPRITGEITGTARFWSKDPEKDPVVLLFSSTVLNVFRIACLRTLADCGIYPPENYGFIPHITLDYVKKENRVTLPPSAPIETSFPGLELWKGEQEKYLFPFGVKS